MSQPYSVRLQPEAVEQFQGLDPERRRRIRAKLQWLAENADAVRHHPLSRDLAGLCKRRIGSYRVIYMPLSSERALVVYWIGHRRDVYDKA